MLKKKVKLVDSVYRLESEWQKSKHINSKDYDIMISCALGLLIGSFILFLYIVFYY